MTSPNGHVDPPDSPTAEAILRTLLYADVFDFPMTDAEIHHFLIGLPATPDDVQATFEGSSWLAKRIERVNGYCVVQGRAETADERHKRDAASEQLWPLARRYGIWLAHLPFVRMVALTGALSMRNANSNRDDIDYLLVTRAGRVWTARALAVLIVRLARLFGVGLCPNYVLSEDALAEGRRDLFTAHELAQMIPLTGHNLYESMRRANQWATRVLPNATVPFYQEPDNGPRSLGRFIQRLGELALSGPWGDALENWERRRKLRKFASDSRKAGASAVLDEQHVKGHFNDYGYPTLDHYRARLEDHALADDSFVVDDSGPQKFTSPAALLSEFREGETAQEI